MPTTTDPEAPTIADLLERLGGIDPRRVLMRPLPGKARERDLERMLSRKRGLYELVEGTLVEKVMGARESLVASRINHLLALYIDTHDLGELLGEAGAVRLMGGLVRIPDVSFIRREQFPGGQFPEAAIPDLYPDLAIEVLSEGNTPAEIERKLKEYFLAGTTLAWLVDPRTRTVAVHTAPDVSRTLTEADTLDGGTVLPGLALPVRRVFERLPAPPPRRGKKKPRA
jgi:Uma2 family endonuclease